jgi:hypothetical protein
MWRSILFNTIKCRLALQIYIAVATTVSPKSPPKSSRLLVVSASPSTTAISTPCATTTSAPCAAAVASDWKMTKAVKNREQSERASNQKRDPRTGRFTRAPQGVVVRRASAAPAGIVDIVPDVPPGFERIAPNLNRAGGSAFPSAKPKVECLTLSLLRGFFNSIRRCSSFISSITH